MSSWLPSAYSIRILETAGWASARGAFMVLFGVGCIDSINLLLDRFDKISELSSPLVGVVVPLRAQSRSEIEE